jgi:DNA invertase Pin-like site-specific DNA recombinase
MEPTLTDAPEEISPPTPSSKRPLRNIPWSEIRSTYEHSTVPVATIAKAYAVRERAIYERAAKEGWAARRAQGGLPPTDVPLDRSVLVKRLFQAVERQIADIERRLASLTSTGSDEKDARTLAALARTIELLIGLERQAKSETPEAPEADVDDLRRELARRIANLRRAGGD